MSVSDAWKPVRRSDTEQVAAARLALHHAAQVAAAFGATHLEADADHQYANLGWSEEHDALLGREVKGLQAGIRLGDAHWILVRGEELLEECFIPENTVAEGLDWLAWMAESKGGVEGALTVPGYELPDHPSARGEAFEAIDADAAAVVEDWFRSSAAALSAVAEANAGASEVRAWPHHFDIATLITIEGTGENARSVNVGMTPGDGGIGEPYLYVSPWPYPKHKIGPELPVGRWQTEGWFGAVLQASALPVDGQTAAVGGFVPAAIAGCRELAGR